MTRLLKKHRFSIIIISLSLSLANTLGIWYQHTQTKKYAATYTQLLQTHSTLASASPTPSVSNIDIAASHYHALQTQLSNYYQTLSQQHTLHPTLSHFNNLSTLSPDALSAITQIVSSISQCPNIKIEHYQDTKTSNIDFHLIYTGYTQDFRNLLLTLQSIPHPIYIHSLNIQPHDIQPSTPQTITHSHQSSFDIHLHFIPLSKNNHPL